MSYSRWIESDFYTFWCGSKAKKREDEQFCCMYSLDNSPMFGYNDVKEMIKDPNLMYEKIKKDLTEDQVFELLAYMMRFVADVDRHYEKKLLEIRCGQ